MISDHKIWFISSISNSTQLVQFKTLKNVVRGIFLTLGMIVVLYGFYGTMREVNEMRVLLQEEVEIKEKYLYPSITFCYKFKHGGKEALRNYHSFLFEKWKDQGTKC